MTFASGPPAPAGSIAEAIQRMLEIQSSLPDSDGLKWFNFLYLAVTQAVQDEITNANTFEDSGWIDRLDVAFANLYFAAISAAQQQGVEAAPAPQHCADTVRAGRDECAHQPRSGGGLAGHLRLRWQGGGRQ